MEITAEQQLFMDKVNADVALKIEAHKVESDTSAKVAAKAEASLLIEAFKSEQPDLKDSEIIIALSQKVDALKIVTDEPKATDTVGSFISANFEDYKTAIRANREFEVTATAFTRSGVTNSEQGTELTGIGQIGHRKLTFRDVFAATTFSDTDDNGTIKYIDWDAASSIRAAAAVAEGGTFPESTAVFAQKTATYNKIGDSIPTTEEVLEDQSLIARELEMFLSTNVEIAEDTAFIASLAAQAPAYTAVASGLVDASIYDLIVKMSESITTAKGSKYMPNFAFMNISDINKMKLKKDANNNYIMPPFATNGGTQVDGITVVEDNGVTADTFYLGDNRYGRIYDKKGYVLSKGTVSTQFVEDQLTLKGRKRSLFLIREADKTGFLECAGIKADLATLATVV